MTPEEIAKTGFQPRPAIPHNPLINAGAIMVASMLYREKPLADRFDAIMNVRASAADSASERAERARVGGWGVGGRTDKLNLKFEM